MKSRQTTLIVLIVVLFAGLAALIGIFAFRWGQQTSTAKAPQVSEVTSLTSTASPTPPATATSVPPPPVVTNTPTATSAPTSTPAPTLTPTPSPTHTRTPTNTPTPTPTPIVVITHVNSLGKLETIEFAIRTVIDLENEPANLWEKIFGSDQLILVAEGEVVGGIDLDKVKPEDIAVRGTTVNITLPPPEILYSRVDNERSYVYERNTGLLRPIDPTLESRARQLAEQSMVDWAIQRDIYSKATDSARLRMENLLRSLGFTEIVIRFKPEPL